jgi:serine protease AprX
MKKYYLLLVLCSLVFSFTASSQYSRHIIRFKNKNGTAFSLTNPAAYLSAKAISRRAKYKIAVDSTDLPVKSAYIDSIRGVPNVTILNSSKWLNQVCIKTNDPAALAKINSFSFVKSSAPVAVRLAQPQPAAVEKFNEFIQQPSPIDFNTAFRVAADFYNYGNNVGQVHIHEGEYLHNMGYRGEGMVIAILDGGFLNYKTNIAFDSIRLQNQILGVWDYVANEESVNEDNSHGTWCLSVLAANRPGKIIGTAPKAKYWLFRTEDVASEYPVEEENWVAAAEFADSAGVDIITSSLGYSDFDDHSFDHSYAQRNGTTSIVSIGASMAVRKGILVTNSAGNSGSSASDLKYVICPADADSVLTVGAVDVNGTIAGFSSWGPNGAGKLKPNVVSVGQSAVVASAITGEPAFLNGTSFSNPNMCGLVACLWQAFPEFSNMEIINALQKSASRYTNPDNRFGYGIPNMRLAYTDLQQQRIVKNSLNVLGDTWIKAFPVPFLSSLDVLVKAPASGNASLRLVDMNGKVVDAKTVAVQEGSLYTISFDRTRFLSNGVYTIQYADGKNKTSLRVVKQ